MKTKKEVKCKYCLDYVFEKNKDGSLKTEHDKCKNNFNNLSIKENK